MNDDLPTTSYVPEILPFKINEHAWQPQRGSYIECSGECPFKHRHGHKLPDNKSLNRDEEGNWIIETLY